MFGFVIVILCVCNGRMRNIQVWVKVLKRSDLQVNKYKEFISIDKTVLFNMKPGT